MKHWDSDQLWLKARAYLDLANALEHSDPRFPLWSAMGLELLARAALTRIHPVLNADPRNDVNILYGCGIEVVGQPRSLPAHSVFLRLVKIVPAFGKAQRELCDFLSLLRNQELHTAELPFENLKESKWLPRYYDVCQVLCAALGHRLTELLGDELAPVAERLIGTLEEETRAGVTKKIADCRSLFRNWTVEKQTLLRAEARAALQLLMPGTQRETCPACESEGLATGSLSREHEPEYVDETLYVNQELVVGSFRCFVCGLGLRSLEEVTVAGIEPRFTQVRETSMHELYEPEWLEEYDNM